MGLETIIAALLIADIAITIVCNKKRAKRDRQKFIEAGAIRVKLDKVNRDIEILQDLIGDHVTEHSILEMDIQKLADELGDKIHKEIWCTHRPKYVFIEELKGYEKHANRNNQ